MEEIKNSAPELETLVGLSEEDLKELEKCVNSAKNASSYSGCGSMLHYDIAEINKGIDLLNSEIYYHFAKDKSAEEVKKDTNLARLLENIMRYGGTPRTNELLARQGFKEVKRYKATYEELLKDYSKIGNCRCELPSKVGEKLVDMEMIAKMFHGKAIYSINCTHQIECISKGNAVMEGDRLKITPAEYILTVYNEK
jgi:hypothetical protein